MTARLWVAGGTQGRAASVAARGRHTPLYTAGVLASLDADHALRVEQRDVSNCGQGSVFKGISTVPGGRSGDGLLLCHDAEVLGPLGHRASLPMSSHTSPRRSHRLYNDVHHAIEYLGARYVVSTGLGAVLVHDDLDADVHVHAVGALPVPPDGDHRRTPLRSAAHPNHLFVHDDRVWVTRGGHGDAVSLEFTADRAPSRSRVTATPDVGGRSASGPEFLHRWPIADVVLHDGVVRPDGIWFTAVDGHLLRVDPERGQVDREIRLDAMSSRAPPLGWCRGLAFVDDLVWVGFTRLRATTLRRNLAWVRGLLRGQQHATPHPTRLVAYDLARGSEVIEVRTDAPTVAMDAIFGLEAAP